MTPGTLTVILLVLVCWNGFLHLKLTRESVQRRELAIAFRLARIERRHPA